MAIEAAARILRERFPVERIVLFGSKARGEDDPESDIDLLIVTSRCLTFEERAGVIRELYPLQLTHGVVFSTMQIPREEWEHGVYQVLPIRSEIERDGAAA